MAHSRPIIAVVARASLWRTSICLMRDIRLRIGNRNLARPRFDRSHRPAGRRGFAPKQ
jgi:hypothetical protein